MKKILSMLVVMLFILSAMGNLTSTVSATVSDEAFWIAPSPVKTLLHGRNSIMMVLLENGDVYGWGDSNDLIMSLGLGGTRHISKPTKIIDNVQKMVDGYFLKTNGELWAVGNNRICATQIPILRDERWSDEEWTTFEKADRLTYPAPCVWPVKVAENVTDIKKFDLSSIYVYKRDSSYVFTPYEKPMTAKEYEESLAAVSGNTSDYEFYLTPNGELYVYYYDLWSLGAVNNTKEELRKAEEYSRMTGANVGRTFRKRELILLDVIVDYGGYGYLTTSGELYSVKVDAFSKTIKTKLADNVKHYDGDYILCTDNVLYKFDFANKTETVFANNVQSFFKNIGDYDSYAYIGVDGKLYTWGNNNTNGQLGVPPQHAINMPQHIMDDAKEAYIFHSSQISSDTYLKDGELVRMGKDHVGFFLKNNGELWISGGSKLSNSLRMGEYSNVFTPRLLVGTTQTSAPIHHTSSQPSN